MDILQHSPVRGSLIFRGHSYRIAQGTSSASQGANFSSGDVISGVLFNLGNFRSVCRGRVPLTGKPKVMLLPLSLPWGRIISPGDPMR